MLLGTIERLGDQPLRNVIDSMGGWPVLDPDWLSRSGDWNVEMVIGRVRGAYNFQILIESWVAADDKNSSINVIQVG